MRLLIDSHSLIWYVDQDHLLSPLVRNEMANAANQLYLSAATIWEISIKVGLTKLSLSKPYKRWMSDAVAGLSFDILPITVDYADRQAALPTHRRDPFDRLIVAQALVEGIPVSADPILDSYGATRIW